MNSAIQSQLIGPTLASVFVRPIHKYRFSVVGTFSVTKITRGTAVLIKLMEYCSPGNSSFFFKCSFNFVIVALFCIFFFFNF